MSITTTPSTCWSSRLSFVFAASAAAIGLGNIWRFPYMAGQNGGAIFVLMYLACVIFLGIPLLMAEVVLGRMGRKNPAAAIRDVAVQSNHSRYWACLGGMNILASFLILTYYVVITGWVLNYLTKAVLGYFAHITEANALNIFISLQSNPSRMLLTDSIVVIGSIFIIYLGIKRGLERGVMFMFPALIFLMIVLLGYAMTTTGFTKSLVFLFKPDLHELTARTILLALGQAFFSLNVAMGVTIMFSAYLPKKIPLISSVITIAIADTTIAMLAGLVIFPIVFANHLVPAAGPSLIFQTLPLAFSKIPGSTLIAVLFFLMLFFAAFTSVIALLEPAVCWLMETCNMSRHKSVLYVGTTVWLLSLAAIISFSHGKYIHVYGVTYFKMVDYITANIMLPVGGLLLAIFTGWLLSKKSIYTELSWNINGTWFQIWRFILRYIAPLAILFILLSAFKII